MFQDVEILMGLSKDDDLGSDEMRTHWKVLREGPTRCSWCVEIRLEIVWASVEVETSVWKLSQ